MFDIFKAIKYNLIFVKHLGTPNYPKHKNLSILLAAKHGSLGVLKCIERDTKADSGDQRIFVATVEGGQLDVLKWLRRRWYTKSLDKKDCLRSIKFGHLEALKWLVEENFPLGHAGL